MNELRLNQVSVQFKSVNALTHIDIAFNKGDIALLAGPNGAGKSTVIKVLLGLVTPQTGQIMLNGSAIRISPNYKKLIGYLPENVAFAENLSGYQILKFFASARGVSRDRIDITLDEVGLSHAARRAVRGYSKGMRQRLGLAVAMLHDPEFLILDEPTGGLDQEGLGILWKLLTRFKEREKTVLLSSHDLTLLEKRVTKICILRAGKLLCDLPPSELRYQTQLPLNVDFDLKENDVEAEAFITAVRDWSKAIDLHHEGRQLNVHIAPHQLMELMDIKSGHSGAIQRLRVEEPGLDRVYETLLEAP